MKRLIAGSSLALVLVFTSTAASANGNAGIPITVTVPEICNVEAADLELDVTTGRIVGSVFEMCNSGRGFQIMASHRPLEAGESVQLNYNGQLADLSESGISPVAHRAGASFGNVPVVIESRGLKTGLAISIGMMAV